MTAPTTDTLRREIDVARAGFRQLNDRHWYRSPGAQFRAYRALSFKQEARICELADTLARLRRFESLMRVKELLTRIG